MAPPRAVPTPAPHPSTVGINLPKAKPQDEAT
jgi:hypothetical protein